MTENPGKPINQNDFVGFCDHIFTKIHFSCAHRSGLTANITMAKFKQRELGDDSMIRLNVKDHKTIDTYGSAPLILYQLEVEWISMFINNVRSKISSVNNNYVFNSWNGDKMISGDISGQLHSLWEKAGVFENRFVTKKLSPNIIRKSPSTLVRQTDKEKSQVLVPIQGCTV